LTRHRATIAVRSDRLIPDLLGCRACPITKIGDPLVANPLRSCRLAIAVIRDALNADYLRRRTIAVCVIANALSVNDLASGLSLSSQRREGKGGGREEFTLHSGLPSAQHPRRKMRPEN
jgi:hypothetical protein